MKKPEERAAEITAHTPEGSVRARVRADLTNFLAALDNIRELSEAASTDKPKQPKDSNGIDSLDISELDAREAARIENLRRNQIMEGDLEDEVVETTTPAPTVKKSDRVLTYSLDINSKGRFGYTKLIAAVVANNIEEVRRLLTVPGIDVNITDRSGATALDKAFMEGFTEIVELLGGTFATDEN